jgi:hypothetical protein
MKLLASCNFSLNCSSNPFLSSCSVCIARTSLRLEFVAVTSSQTLKFCDDMNRNRREVMFLCSREARTWDLRIESPKRRQWSRKRKSSSPRQLFCVWSMNQKCGISSTSHWPCLQSANVDTSTPNFVTRRNRYACLPQHKSPFRGT